MIDNRSVQRFLAARGTYRGAIDGIFGEKSKAAMGPALIAAGIDAAGWDNKRLRVAVEQLMMREAGIETGDIDGLIGPQTEFAREQWQNRLRDLDPPAGDVRHQPNTFPRQFTSAFDAYYGAPGTGQTMLRLPYPMKLAWNTGQVIRSISLHEKVKESASRAFANILAHYGEPKIKALGLDLFGGSLNVRRMRGGSRHSMHSWGIAIDFDPAHNRLRWGRDRACMAKPAYAAFLDIWEEEGWISLGRERNYDWMHIQAARL